MVAPASDASVVPDLGNLVPLDAMARFHGASRLPLATAMYIGANIARAVAEQHDRGHVLGTLDANRIRCSHDGQVLITAQGGSFMSPETKRGEPPDVLSDIYAVGAIVYRLLTGMTPLQAMTRQPVSRLHVVPAPSALIPGIDPALDEVLLSCLAHDPGERPISARVISSTIEGVFAELELIASPSGVVRAVKATDTHRMKPRASNWAEEYTQPGVPRHQEGRTETHGVVSTSVEDVAAPTLDLQSIIVSPSLCAQPAITESPTVQTAAAASSLVQPTRPILPEVQNPTALERPSRVGGRSTEAPTQSMARVKPQPEKTSLIYGHPFFRRDSGDVEALSAEMTGDDPVPFEQTYLRVRQGARFAGEVWADARGRLGRKWRRASPGARRLAIAGFLGAVTLLSFGFMLSFGSGEAQVEVAAEHEVTVANKPVVAKAAPAPAAPAPAPAPAPAAPAPAPVAAAPVSTARAVPVVPARPAVKTQAPAKVSKSSKAKKKLSKRALAKKKAAAKRAAARRAAR